MHGEKHNMMRLKSKLLSLNTDKVTKTKIFSPANTEELRIPFKVDKTARVVGSLAQIPPPKSEADEERVLNGVLVQNDFKMSLMVPEDLREYAGLTTTTIMCKQRLMLSAAGIDLIKWALEGTFGSIEEISAMRNPVSNGESQTNGNGMVHDVEGAEEGVERNLQPIAFLIMGCVIVRYHTSGEVSVEWEGNMLNDGIADAVLAVLMTVESSPAAVKRKRILRTFEDTNTNMRIESSKKHQHAHHSHRNPHANVTPAERFSRLCMFLEAQFGPLVSPIEHPKLPQKAPKLNQENDGTKHEPDDDDEEDYEPEEDPEDVEAAEMERLHSIGIPVPGVEIKVDKNVAKVWLETLEVECASAILRERVRAVVERAVETVAPLWGRSVG